MQERYWNFMIQVKASIYYLDIYLEESYKIDTIINIICAIASTASIGAWAIFKIVPFLWSFIIAISQVITAIKIYLPYSKRITEIKPFLEELNHLHIKIEHEWYDVASGKMTETQINDLLFEFKKSYTSAESNHMNSSILFRREDIMCEADKLTLRYFENKF